MNKWLKRAASLKVAVALLVLLLLGLAAGTIIETSAGTEVAGQTVYYSYWFMALEGVFGLNLLAALITGYPWSRERLGFLVTHGALIVILLGALVSYFGKVEGQLGLWEGQASNVIVCHNPDGTVTLPFTVKLDRFRVDYYQGTRQPANFRSDVEILDGGGALKAGIWMNHELEHRGWRFYQSSYRQEGGYNATILSVSKDPGQPIVFFGYGLLLLGMVTVLGTRMGQVRSKARIVAAVGLLAVVFAGFPAHAGTRDLDAIRRLPVQHDGRIMPLDTLARETVHKVTGQRSLEGDDPVETFLSWVLNPQGASTQPSVALGSAALAQAAGLPPARLASFQQLAGNPNLAQLLAQARQAEEQGMPRQGVLPEAEKLLERALLLQSTYSGELLHPIPPPGDVRGPWSPTPLAREASSLAALARGPRLQGWPSPRALDREITYNAVRPTRVAWIVLLAALLLSMAGWKRRSRLLDALAMGGLVLGVAVMTWGIGTRWIIGGRIPAANMYESLLFLAWGVGVFALVAFAVLRNRLVVVNACTMAALTMALTDLLPMDSFIHPVAPVLSGTPWLAIHVPIIMVSYSVLALGVVIAHMQIGLTIFAPRKTANIQRMNDLLYWYLHVGSILLIAGIMTGSIWASESWGRYWGWDPKEVWSLVAFLAYAAILHARWDRQIAAFGVAAISIIAFQTILMTYLGVNFVLGMGLHSYGMGDTPVLSWMILVAVLEAAFLLLGLLAVKRSAGNQAPESESRS
jgi:cytochrome c-type biogenesis protein CcsB